MMTEDGERQSDRDLGRDFAWEISRFRRSIDRDLVEMAFEIARAQADAIRLERRDGA